MDGPMHNPKHSPMQSETTSEYSFERDDFNSHHDEGGTCTQAALRVVSRADPQARFLVLVGPGQNETSFRCLCPPGRERDAGRIIEVTQVELGARWAQGEREGRL